MSNSPQIIPINTSGAKKPENLLSGISEIQQYYVLESQGDDLHPDFFTIEMYMSFMKLGAISAWHETAALIFIGLGEYFLLPIIFALFRPANFPFWLKNLPFAGMLINTILCAYLSKYYIGKLTRRIISALLTGRLIALILIAFLLYVSFMFLDGITTEQRIASLLNWLSIILKNAPYYYGVFFSMKPLHHISSIICILIIISGFTPFIFAFLISYLRGCLLKRNEKKINTQ